MSVAEAATVVSDAADSARFDALIRPLVNPAFRLAAVTLEDATEAEDAVQDAAIKAWRRLGSLRDESAVRSWFLSIVVNECRNRRRRPWWRVLRFGDLPAAAPAAPADLAESVDLAAALHRLPADDRLLVQLRFGLDLPMEDVASALGVKPGACRTRLHRALARLRPGLEIDEELLR